MSAAPHSRPGILRLSSCALLALALGCGAVRADWPPRLVIQGLQDLELHETDADSRLLSRNEGELASRGALRLWIASELAGGLQAVVLGRFEDGDANADDGSQHRLDQAFLRYVTPGRARLMIDAGKIVVPFGNFSKRYLSKVNPLIGSPDSYDVSYPTGVVVTGRAAWFDYRLAVLDAPLANEKYLPSSDAALRAGYGIGVTPMIGLRFGGYYTQGPYLGRDAEPNLPAGEHWRDFDQEIVGLELEFSRGYFELNGDVAFSSYEVPTVTGVSRGVAWFVEPKYTWTPRLFTALRIERNDYPFVRPVSPTFWIAAETAFVDVEVGAGWRFTPQLLLKASYRQDDWRVDEADEAMFPDGHAVALQLSYGFDVRRWIERRD